VKKLLSLLCLMLLASCNNFPPSAHAETESPTCSCPDVALQAFQSSVRTGTFLPETVPHGLGAKPRMFWLSVYSPGDENFTPMGELTADAANLYLGATNSNVKYVLHAIK